MAWSTNPTDEYTDLEDAVETVLTADSFLGSGTYSLSSDTTAAQTTLWLTTTGLPTKGTVLIGSERIRYTGKSGDTITGCSRGSFETTAAAHSAAATVTTYNVANIFDYLSEDLRDYPPEKLPAIAFETLGNPEDTRAAMGSWDHHLELEFWVVTRDTDYSQAAQDCKLITSEVRRCLRVEEKANNDLENLLDNGQIFIGRTVFSRRTAQYHDRGMWWKRSTTMIRVYHEETE